MYFKSPIILVIAISIIAGLKFNSIKVPEGLDNGYSYKLTGFVVITASSLAKGLAWLNIGEELANFRKIISYGIQFEGNQKSEFNVEKTNKVINGVGVRIYEPKDKMNGKMPALIYYHGGGYAFGDLRTYDLFIEKIVDKQKMVAISVDYRMSPEYPFPTPTDDCYAVTKYIFEHSDEFSVDPDRVALAGDSAGGNVVAALTQRFLKEGKQKPKLQILVYPWMQMANVDLPSFQLYNELGWFRLINIGFGQYTKWYLNIDADADQIFDTIESYEHVKALEDEQLKDKFLNYLNTSLIPAEYISKDEEDYYKNYSARLAKALSGTKGPNSKILEDKKVKESLLKIFDVRVSPGFADKEALVGLPKAHFVISERDSLKDEALIYAERLKQAGVAVNVKYYKKAFHGILSFLRPPLDFKLAHEISNDIQDFIGNNI